MKSPAWLEELHRQWFAARGRRSGASQRPFTRDWPRLLEDAGIRSAEDFRTAEREGEKLEKEGLVVLKRHRSRRYLIERLELPLASEPWLRSLFGSNDPRQLREESLAVLNEMLARQHPLHPELWIEWLDRLRERFEAGKNQRPLSWLEPERLRHLLGVAFALTAESWGGHLIREISDRLGLGSKGLERSKLQVQAVLRDLFGQPVTLGMLGIIEKELQVDVAGHLCLHFADGLTQEFDRMEQIHRIGDDLDRAVSASTQAKRILTVENRKTTLRRLASLNEDRETLLIACAFPGPGLVKLLQLLPKDLPLYHFGDTDPAGYLILSKMRQIAGKPVEAFRMEYRSADRTVPLSEYDRRLLPSLLAEPLLADVRPHLEKIFQSGDKGAFEQESLGVPSLSGWPFYV